MRVELLDTNSNPCDNLSNDNASYALVYQNPDDGTLELVHQQQQNRVTTPPIYLNTSGIYCVYRQCPAVQMDYCCIKATGKDYCIIFNASSFVIMALIFKVSTEMTILFTESTATC